MRRHSNILIFVFLLPFFVFAQIELPKHSPNAQIIRHKGYTLQYNEAHEQAEWVAYQLTDSEVYPDIDRTNDYRSDPQVKTGSATISDYRHSGYDRGHLAPAADMEWSNTAMSQSFYLSNMSPQEAGFNRGIWRKLESTVRNWAIENEEVYVVTAGILEPGLKDIGSNDVSVPDYYYKVILDYKLPERKAIGFILPNRKCSKSLADYAVTVDDVEMRTGIDFFHSIPDEREKELESKIDINDWSFDSYYERSTRVSFPINVNSASRKDLKALPGIGDVLSKRIIEYRTTHYLNSVEDLDDIRGIGPKTVEKLRGKVSF